ncbi:MAG: hypothetical protein K2L72_04010, partial [Clostridia bacterium]|nr:hypothetical protein [Clostridia bacterium]
LIVRGKKKKAADNAVAEEAPVDRQEQSAAEVEPVATEEPVEQEPQTAEEEPVAEEPVAEEEPVEEEPVAEEESAAEEEPAVEETHEEQPVVPAEEPAETVAEEGAEVAEEEASDEAEAEDDECELKMVEEDGKTRFIVIKYSKSFLAKLIQSDGETKRYYSEIKNTLLSYEGVKSRVSWKWEAFRKGRQTVAKLRLRGKTLSLALALDPARYEETKYIVESLAEIKSYADTPCLYRIKNERRLRYSAELIATVMQENGAEQIAEHETVDYAVQHPYETTEALLERKLIKELTDEAAQSGTKFKPAEIKQSVTVTEADSLLDDELAEMLVVKEGGVSDKTRTGIVNIDTLSQYFNDGETVTLDEVKKRVPEFNKKTTYLKVLARGTLDK